MILVLPLVCVWFGLAFGAQPDFSATHEIQFLTGHANHHTCQEMAKIDCNTYHINGDEQICGTDGVTYSSHCWFVHAVCDAHGNGGALHVANHGVCPATTAPPPTQPPATQPPATQPPATQPPATQPPATNPPQTTGAAATAATTVTTMAPTTTQPPATTNALNPIFANLFCQNVNSISCTSSGFTIVCGTNGQLYPNSCELSKAACTDTTLTIEPDQTKCNLPGGP